MRDFAPQKWLGYFFLVFENSYSYSRDACTDFDAKYVKRRGFAQGSAFLWSRNQNLRFLDPHFPKNRHFWAPFRRHRIFSPENGFNIERLESKRPLIVVVAQKSCIVNRQNGVGDSKCVIGFDPLFTGHVIRRMRSGRVRIFNANQWETL